MTPEQALEAFLNERPLTQEELALAFTVADQNTKNEIAILFEQPLIPSAELEFDDDFFGQMDDEWAENVQEF